MNVSAPFIRRPVATTLLAIAVVLAGGAAYTQLPVAPLVQRRVRRYRRFHREDSESGRRPASRQHWTGLVLERLDDLLDAAGLADAKKGQQLLCSVIPGGGVVQVVTHGTTAKSAARQENGEVNGS